MEVETIYQNDDKLKVKPIGVFVKRNSEGEIVEINSELFITDFSSYEKIDEGYGDKFAHAQNQYFDKPLLDENGKYRYK